MTIPDYFESPSEIIQAIGALALPEKCPDCRVWPLCMKPEQGIAFCWGCVIDRSHATVARALLVKAKLAALPR